ncbi:hypothetical protein D3C76_1344260 [compost metagenome]
MIVLKLFEFSRYNVLDDDVQQELFFDESLDGAYEQLYGYKVPVNDRRRAYWSVKEIPIKEGKVILSF